MKQCRVKTALYFDVWEWTDDQFVCGGGVCVSMKAASLVWADDNNIELMIDVRPCFEVANVESTDAATALAAKLNTVATSASSNLVTSAKVGESFYRARRVYARIAAVLTLALSPH